MSVDDRANGTGIADAAPARTGSREERVSVVSGDRFCTHCGYNLVGQSVLREPHYEMFIVRCPECATVAALQEYPLLGRWASRWAALFAILYFIMLMGAWTGSSAALFGLSVGCAEEASRDYTRHLQEIYEQETAIPPTPTPNDPTAPTPTALTPTQTPTPTPTLTPTQAPTSPAPPARPALPATLSGITVPPQIMTQVANQMAFADWWAAQDRDAILAARGGRFGAIDRSAYWLWLPSGIAAFVIGTFWAIALLNARRRYLPLWGLVLVSVAAVFCAIEMANWMSDATSRSWRIGRGQLGPTFAALTLGYLMIPLFGGLLLGRSTARLLVRALLPPRLRYALALLWHTDGLDVPPARRRVSR